MADTHGIRSSLAEALKAMGDIELLIHAGDFSADAKMIQQSIGINTVYVRGNCDFDYATPDELEIELEGWKFFITHGHNYGVKYGLEEIISTAIRNKAHFCIFGHTHQQVLEHHSGCIVLNPGSPSYPRMSKASCAVIELDENTRPVVQHVLL